MQEKRENLTDIDPKDMENDNLQGLDEIDDTRPRTAKGGLAGDGVTSDEGGVDQVNAATTEDGGLALDGGKLAGNQDDFDGALDASRRMRNVPGADPNNEVKPPNDRDLRQ